MTPRTGSQGRSTYVTDEERAPGQDLFGLGERERRAVLAWVGENLPQVRRSGSGAAPGSRALPTPSAALTASRAGHERASGPQYPGVAAGGLLLGRFDP